MGAERGVRLEACEVPEALLIDRSHLSDTESKPNWREFANRPLRGDELVVLGLGERLTAFGEIVDIQLDGLAG
jgi:hypothetical protein